MNAKYWVIWQSNGTECTEGFDTEREAAARRRGLEDRHPDPQVRVEPWSTCKSDGCDGVPEYGMVYCSQCTG